MARYDTVSFLAGQDSGARISACAARLAALELLEHSHWWNRRRHGLMARTLIALAEEVESDADADRLEPVAEQGDPTLN
jgi:hypothetical protein